MEEEGTDNRESDGLTIDISAEVNYCYDSLHTIAIVTSLR